MKTWLVTGANRGLGLAIAKAALEAGDSVAITARNPMGVPQALHDAHGPRLRCAALDVTDKASVGSAVQEVMSAFGRIDVLVNNAGYGQFGVFEQVSVQAVEQQFATNVFGVFAVTRAVLPHMRAQGGGRIFTVSSIAGLAGFKGASIYCASKFALEGWSEALAQEVSAFGIHAMLVEPGFFRTDFLDASSVRGPDSRVADYDEYTERRADEFAGMNHRQLGDPERLGRALVELAAAVSPPMRFCAGSDAYAVIRSRGERQRAEAEAWRALSASTDFLV
jgi:NAD(P)-dependent dehydrogenase (short-subunit alcohol dehydrogenase family)